VVVEEDTSDKGSPVKEVTQDSAKNRPRIDDEQD
jgi:hypothetical protein